MLTLTPQWILFDEFWISLKKRNRLFIKLRYGAVVLLSCVIIGIQFLRSIYVDPVPIMFITIGILLYNVLFQYIWNQIPPRHTTFHGVHFALLQISADFLALMILIYYTGGIETPLYFLFIFHVILGSLLLPGSVVVLIITSMLMISLGGALLEAHAMIPHHAIMGLYATPIYNSTEHLILHFAAFSLTLYVSIYLANSISKELYKRERSLTIAYRKLEEAEKTKTRYIMSVVHDLKTPIVAVQTYLDLIIDRALGEIGEQISKRLERARLRTADALAMINDILQISQLKLANHLHVSDINLIELLEEVHGEMEEIYSQKSIEFVIENEEPQPPIIQADRISLKLVIGNLLGNASKYTPKPGKVLVKIKEEQRGVITFSVQDNGIGIPQNDLPKIFNDFYRGTNSKKLGIEGTGLGTSVITHVVHQHHGTVRAESPSELRESDERPGASFIVSLPIQYSPEEEIPFTLPSTNQL